jgi:orotidine-5'-phosphate decarboxylase
MNDKKIIVALDSINLYDSKYLVDEIKNQVFAFKIGYDFFLNFGLDGYNQIKNKKVNIFLDLKLHDIPNTIKNGIEAIVNLNPYFTTIHITGGDEMQKIANMSKKKC